MREGRGFKSRHPDNQNALHGYVRGVSLVMTYFAYVLESESTARLYIGHSNDPLRRVSEHNAGHTTSTRGRGPWALIFTREFATRAEAVRLERHLKALKRPDKVRTYIQSFESGQR